MHGILSVNSFCRELEQSETFEIDLDAFAKKIGMSKREFAFLFRETTGYQLSDYIQLRKLSTSAIDLQEKELSIYDISIKYGYSSDKCYSRAFKKVYGFPPKMVKKGEKKVPIMHPISLIPNTVGGYDDIFSFYYSKEIKFIGFSYTLKYEKKDSLKVYYDNLIGNAYLNRPEIVNNKEALEEIKKYKIGDCIYMKVIPEEGILYFSILGEANGAINSKYFKEYIIKPAIYAVFKNFDLNIKTVEEWNKILHASLKGHKKTILPNEIIIRKFYDNFEDNTEPLDYSIYFKTSFK